MTRNQHDRKHEGHQTSIMKENAQLKTKIKKLKQDCAVFKDICEGKSRLISERDIVLGILRKEVKEGVDLLKCIEGDGMYERDVKRWIERNEELGEVPHGR